MRKTWVLSIVVFGFSLLFFTAPGRPKPQELRIGSVRQLFLDDFVIEQTENVRRQFHRPVRYGGNPLLEADQPWEQGGDGVYLFGGTLIFDEEEQIFKMWYRTHVVEKTSAGDAIGEMPKGGYRTCYAISRDGLTWEKPNLGQVKYAGSTDNNMLPPGVGGMEYIRRPNLIKDYQEKDPEKRYKMVYMDEFGEKFVLAKAYSSDGIHWRMNAGQPVFFAPPVIPNGVLFGWDPKIQLYVLFHRKADSIPADVDGRRVRSEPAFMRSTSRDFEHWGETQEIIKRNEQIDPPRWDPAHVGVLAAILYTEDLYIGFLDTCITHSIEDVPENLWEVYSMEHGEHRTELVISRDGKDWKRVAPHWEFLRPGLWGTWDRQHVALSKPIVRNDEILIYYTGNNLSCGAGLADHPQRRLIHKIIDGQRMGYAVGLAKLRLDGFVSMEGYEAGGTVTTRPVVFEGDRLIINARAPKKPFPGVPVTDPQTGKSFARQTGSGSPFGKLRVEILDRNGKAVTGYEAADCDTFSGDETQHLVTWKGKSNLSELAGKPVRLRFYLQNAALYSFQFRAEQMQPSPTNLLCPGCRGRPQSSGEVKKN
jgi:hypothetical protein